MMVALAVLGLTACAHPGLVPSTAPASAPAERPPAGQPGSGLPDGYDPNEVFEPGDGSGRAEGPGAAALDEANFVSPSGNIGCSIIAGYGARCDITDASYPVPPAPADCEGQWGRSASVGPDGLLCVTDTTLGAQRVLGYGENVEVGSFLCVRQPDGMTCENTVTGHAFLLSRAAYRLQ